MAVDLSSHRQDIAKALSTLESALARLVEALAHRPAWLSVEGATNDRVALRLICAAYSAIDYGMEDALGASVVCLGVVGVSSDVWRRAEAVNEAKAALKARCVPLHRIRRRVPVKGEGGATKALPLIRVILRSLQRSDLNLLAAYRKIPLLLAPPISVVYTRAQTRAVYRKSIQDIRELLEHLEGSGAEGDRARLASLNRRETHLALTRERYENIRANIVYARLDARGRGRIQMAAELPLMYALGRRAEPPLVHYPGTATDEGDRPRRARESKLEAKPFLKSLPVYRYLNP